jgi:hypothetical protein
MVGFEGNNPLQYKNVSAAPLVTIKYAFSHESNTFFPQEGGM